MGGANNFFKDVARNAVNNSRNNNRRNSRNHHEDSYHDDYGHHDNYNNRGRGYRSSGNRDTGYGYFRNGNHNDRPPRRHRRKTSIWAYVFTIIFLLIIYFAPKVFPQLLGRDTDKPVSTQVHVESTGESFTFKNTDLLIDHFRKHGADKGYATKEEYLAGANAVIANRDSLHKKEAEDGDDIYYLEDTNEIVFVSEGGYIRTYFCPEDGIEYYDKQ